MSNHRNKFRKATLSVWCMLIMMFAHGQSNIMLHIGDPAPELHYSKWIKGSAIKSYDKDRLYVVEFWATWCVPCKQAMPHLSELAKKYAKEATFIGVNIWEMTNGKPYETSLPAVTKFVADMGERMSYEVIVDNNEQYMGKKWMMATSQNSIPATFLIKEGKVIWIGHPDKLEAVMQKVIEGAYDVLAFKKSFETQTAITIAATAKTTAVLKPIDEAVKEKKYAAAVGLIEQALIDNPSLETTLKDMKFTTLLNHFGEDTAMNYGREWAKESSVASYIVAKAIVDKDGLSKSCYEYAAKIFEEKAKAPRALTPVLHHALASCRNKAGNYVGAIEAEALAIDEAKAALKEGKWPGAIMETTIAEYETALAKYKKQVMKSIDSQNL